MVWNRRSITLTAAAVAAAVALAVAGIIIATRGDTAGHLASAPKPPPSPSPSPTHHQGPLRSPFTGERVHRLKRVLITKIGNTFPERPSTGLARADIVYLIPVEGGLSRIMAVFSSHYPRVIGNVRSARQADKDLLRQFGRPAFAWSGAQPRLQWVIQHGWRIVNLFAGTTGGYFRSANRPEPYNLYANTRTLLKHARGASRARDIGFRFGAPPNGGRHLKAKSVSFPAASFRFTWSPHRQRWLVSMDGSPATSVGEGRLSAPTVVIQRVKVGLSTFLEQGPMMPPDARTVGSGTAEVLRNGKAYNARWSRPSANGGTRFTTSSGKPMTFARGPVWIVLAYGPGSSHWRSGKPV